MRLFPSYPLEALLRAPYEWVSAGLFGTASLLVYLFPATLLVAREWAYAIAGGLLFACAFRSWQGLYLVRYQLNLQREPVWRLDFEAIPNSPATLLLGRGFLWTARHTQRLRDTQNPNARKYLANPKSDATPTSSIGVTTSGRPEIHGVELRECNVYMQQADRVGHTLVLGTTRVGKTRLAELLIAQDIQRNDVVIVFDPKGDAELFGRIVAEAKRCGRLDDLLAFHLGYPEQSCRYNAIGRFSRITEVATRIANQLPNSGNSAAFREFAWRFVNIIAGALVALQRTPNFRLVRRYINDIEPLFIEYTRFFLRRRGEPGWGKAVKERVQKLDPKKLPAAMRGRANEAIALLQYVQTLDLYDPVLDGLVSAYKYDRTYFDKIVSSVGPLMEKLTTGAVADLISPDETETDDPRPILDWLDVIEYRRIVYVGLDSLSDTTVASAIGNAMFADLVSVAGYIYKFGVPNATSQPRIALHADEFNELIGDEFVPLLNKAGGAGFQVTAYTQTWSDVQAQIGSKAKAGQVAGNFNSLIMLRVRELATAEMLIDQLPRVGVAGKSTSSGAGDASKPDAEVDFETSHADTLRKSEVPLVSTTDLFSLPRGHAFALLDGGRLWKVRFPLPKADDELLPQSMEDAFRVLLADTKHVASMQVADLAEHLEEPVDSSDQAPAAASA